jgi:hypothetical protein
MVKKFQTWLDMLRSVAQLAQQNSAVVALIAAFLAGINSLKGKLQAIDAIIGQYGLAITGPAVTKARLREQLSQLTFSIISRVKAYAISINDDTLRNQCSLSLSALRKIVYTEVCQQTQALHDIIAPLVNQLQNYSISNADMQAWQTSITDLKTVLSIPRNTIVEHHKANVLISKLIHEAMSICYDILDPISIGFIQNGNEDFYIEYKKIRKLVPYGLTTTKYKTLCTQEDGTPIPNAVVTISGTVLSSKTDINGKAHIDVVPIGMHIITVNAPGLDPKSSPELLFVKGKTTSYNFILTPAFNIPAPQENPENVNA